MRRRRDDEGWPAPPTTSESAEPRLLDASLDGAIRDLDPASRRGHPVWASLAMVVVINFGLIGALALVAWFWGAP